MFKKIARFSILLLFNTIIAQNQINGLVTDSKTKEPIPGVSILIQNSNIGTTTDFEGKFSLSYPVNSNYVIVASYTGYIKKKIVIDSSNRHTVIQISLHEQIMELDEVILSTPFNKLQSENVVRVAYKSIKVMQKRGTVNLMDGISQITGVTQMSTGSGISKPVIRGLSGSRVLVYNQGVRLENFQFGSKHGLGINESGIESVEVIKGPASLLYGSDALGGVIYLIPEKYAETEETEVNLRSQYSSNTLGFNSSLGVKTSTQKWQFLARGSMTSHADYQIPNNLRVTNSRYNDNDFKAGLGFINPNFTTDIRYNFNKAQNGIPHDTGLQESTHKVTGTRQDINNHALSLKNILKLSGSKIKTNLGYTNHKRILLVEEIQKIGMQLNTFNYDAKWYLPHWKDMESIIGVQGMLQTNKNFGIGRLLPDASISNIGLFSTLNYDLGELDLQAGLRYDTRNIITEDIGRIDDDDFRPGFTKKLKSYTGSLGIKYELIEQFNIRINIAGGFRAPNLSELASMGQHEGRIEIGNPEIDNEKNWQTDIAIEYNNTHLEFFANAFYNTIDNYIFLAPTGITQNELPVYQYNQKNAFLYGGEIGLHLHPHPLDWLHIESSFEMVTGKQKNQTYLPLIPANNWDNQIRLTKDGTNFFDKLYWNLGINHTFQAVNITENEVTRPSYTLLNSSISSDFQLNNLNINTTLSLHNILNKEYISHMSILREYEVPNMGRNILLSINLEF